MREENPGTVSGAPDVIIAGGGVIGLVTAWRAALEGLRITVVDPDPGHGAARVAAGMLAAVTELQYGEKTLLRLNLASAARYPSFVEELQEASGADVAYRRCGTLSVALDSDDRAELRELHTFQTSLGLDASWLTGRECRRLEPMLAPGVRGGLRVDGDHQVDPRKLAAALVVACERAGVVLRRASVRRLTVHGGRATGVVLDDGTALGAGTVVIATGAARDRIEGVPEELVPPVRPVKGQVVRLRIPEGFAPFLSRTVRAVVRGGHVYLVPRADGELVVGATSEETGYDATVTAGGVYELLRDAHEVVPGITELPLAETIAGLRPASPDNAPLLGRTALPGLVLATGHYRNGILLTPVTGDLMAEILTTEHTPEQALPFSPDRFSPDRPSKDHPSVPGPPVRPRGGRRSAAGGCVVTTAATVSVSVNGEPRQLPAGLTLDRLVATLTSATSGVAAALNEAVVPRGQWPSTLLDEGDRVEVLTAVQGG